MIRIRDLSFTYPGGDFGLRLDRLDLDAGERLVITGPSGSGKTTLIQLLSGILKPDSGTIRVGDQEISRGNDRAARHFRLHRMGFIFQEFELLEYLTVEQNILLPYLLSRSLRVDAAVRDRMAHLLERTGLAGKERKYPRALSHGEKQRVAVVRALINEAELHRGRRTHGQPGPPERRRGDGPDPESRGRARGGPSYW